MGAALTLIFSVMPAKAGTHDTPRSIAVRTWIAAYAAMTVSMARGAPYL